MAEFRQVLFIGESTPAPPNSANSKRCYDSCWEQMNFCTLQHQAEVDLPEIALAKSLRRATGRFDSAHGLDRVIGFNERQLRRVLESYLEYYHHARPHRSLDHDSPVPRLVESRDCGKVIELSLVGGLHHRYLRQAA